MLPFSDRRGRSQRLVLAVLVLSVAAAACASPAVTEPVAAPQDDSATVDPPAGRDLPDAAPDPRMTASEPSTSAPSKSERAFVAELEARGIPAALTRTGDYAVPIPVRVEFADATDAQMFVSIHHNAPMMPASTEPGTEVFVQSDSLASERLGGLFQDEIVAEFAPHDVAWVSAPDAGALRVEEPDGSESYGIIRLAETPTALVELGYMANPAEAAFFATDAYPAIAAAALADAAEAYLGTDRLEGFRAGVRTFTAGRSHARDDCVNPPMAP